MGGIVLFVGRVRPDRLGSGAVRALDYESDRTLALRAFRELEVAALRERGVGRVVIWHRVGTVAVGEPSVIVGASSTHRAAAFRAARKIIDRLKSDVPLWKSAQVRSARRPRSRLARAPGRSRG